MCDPKPGVRCSVDTCDAAVGTVETYERKNPAGPPVSPLDAGAPFAGAEPSDLLALRVHDALETDEVLRLDGREFGHYFERDAFITGVVDYTLNVPAGQRAEQRYYDAAAAALDEAATDPTYVVAPADPRSSRYWTDISSGVVGDAVQAVLALRKADEPSELAAS